MDRFLPCNNSLHFQFPYGDMLMAYHLEKRWKKLFGSALYRLKTLHSTKIKFSQMTANDIEKFKSEVSLNKYNKFGYINASIININERCE